MSIRVFGLTGGIGSGKSAVGASFRRHGIPTIDADQLAREVVLPGTEGYEEIVRAFGREVLLPDGTLDRAALGKRVFSDPEGRKTLNRITHPRINQRMLESAQRHADFGYELACYEAALIIENNGADFLRPLVVVIASVETRVARIVARDNATTEDALKRISAQIDDAERRKVADFVIENDGTLEDLEQRTVATIDKVLKYLDFPKLSVPPHHGRSA